MTIVEMLSRCPKGTKLYSPLFGDVIFAGTDGSNILVTICKGRDKWFDGEGHFKNGLCSECMLFPSREQRDWNKFRLPINRGDFLMSEDSVFIATGEFAKDGGILAYCGLIDDDFVLSNTRSPWTNSFYVPALPEAKEKLLKAMANHNCEWDADKKGFVIKSLKPFDKVLVRDSPTEEWQPALFWKRSDTGYRTVGDLEWAYCILYAGNENLI